MADIDFSIDFSGFNEGNAPLAHLDTKTYVGNQGQSSEMLADVISKPGFLTQSPGLSVLTNGNEVGDVTELIRFILDKPTAADTTFGLGTSKLFKISSTAVATGGTPSWPQAITNMTEGESVIRLKANLYGFFNKSSGGEIFKMPLSTEVIDQTWGSVTDQALEKSPHPSAVKEDIMVFGNGRYLGVYVEGLAVLDVQKLDFGEGAEVVDVIFHANMFWIAVNSGEGKRSQIYMYDGSAISSILSDETGIGDQEIGFLYVKDGIVYVCYKDLTSGTLTIGYLNGRAIKPLRYFKGTLPDHRQKALYKNNMIFVSDGEIWSFGATVDQLPLQIGRLASGGFATVGGLASPFGTPIVASLGGIYSKIAKFSGYSVGSSWKSVFVDITNNRLLGKVHTIIVNSKALGADAECTVSIEGDQGALTSSEHSYTGTGKTREVFKNVAMKAAADVRLIISYSGGDTTNDCPIRKVTFLGTYEER